MQSDRGVTPLFVPAATGPVRASQLTASALCASPPLPARPTPASADKRAQRRRWTRRPAQHTAEAETTSSEPASDEGHEQDTHTNTRGRSKHTEHGRAALRCDKRANCSARTRRTSAQVRMQTGVECSVAACVALRMALSVLSPDSAPSTLLVATAVSWPPCGAPTWVCSLVALCPPNASRAESSWRRGTRSSRISKSELRRLNNERQQQPWQRPMPRQLRHQMQWQRPLWLSNAPPTVAAPFPLVVPSLRDRLSSLPLLPPRSICPAVRAVVCSVLSPSVPCFTSGFARSIV